MKLTVNRHYLQQGLARIQGVVEKRNTMPILSNVHLEASRGRRKGAASVLRLQATDLEVGLQSEHAAEIGEEGGVTVSARKFYEIVRELPDGGVEVSAIDPVASMQAVDNPALAEVAGEVRRRLESIIHGL